MTATRGSAALVPELTVSDLARSLAFWRDIVGFRILYERPEDPFAYLALGSSEVMLDQHDPAGRHWLVGTFAPPMGNGVNLQIRVAAVSPILDRLAAAGVTLFMPVEEKWYRAADRLLGQRQFIVADPDGYLLRFVEDRGERPAPA